MRCQNLLLNPKEICTREFEEMLLTIFKNIFALDMEILRKWLVLLIFASNYINLN